MRVAIKGLEMSWIHPVDTTAAPGSHLENREFDPFLSHSWSQIGPFLRFFPLRGAKIAQHGPRTGSLHLFVHPK